MGTGIFGGTFDPVHIGHLRAAEEIREAFSLKRVFFIPAFIPPHKRDKKIAVADARLEMLKSAIRGNPCLRVSDTEIAREGVSYTIDTVKLFNKRYKNLFLIMGMDAFFEINTWYRYEELFHHANFIVMTRPGQGKISTGGIFPHDIRREFEDIDPFSFRHTSGNHVYIYHVTQLDLSSSKIREWVKDERSIKYIVPPKIEKIIAERGLYRD